MKELTSRQIAAVKRQFKNSLPIIKKVESINKKIAALEEERRVQLNILEGMESGIIAMTGFRSVDLIQCDYIPQFNEDGTPKMDNENKHQIKKQVLTFVPPTTIDSIVASDLETIIKDNVPTDSVDLCEDNLDEDNSNNE